MPVYRNTADTPAWCEMREFEIVTLKPGEKRVFARRYPKEKLITAEGLCDVEHLGTTTRVERKNKFDVKENDPPLVATGVAGPVETIVIWMGGHWGDVTGGSGIFQVETPAERVERGDPVTYPKTTSFDNHYHDCDEYWIVYQGRVVAVSEGLSYEVGTGDCIVTGMGHHHDFPQAYELVRAAFFETTMEGRKRRGHLWICRDGEAEPDPKRI